MFMCIDLALTSLFGLLGGLLWSPISPSPRCLPSLHQVHLKHNLPPLFERAPPSKLCQPSAALGALPAPPPLRIPHSLTLCHLHLYVLLLGFYLRFYHHMDFP